MKNLSVSQINNFHRNPKYWFYSHIIKLPRCGSDALEYGIKAHDVFSQYFKSGANPEDAETLKYLEEMLEKEALGRNLKEVFSERKVTFKLKNILPLFVGVLDIVIPQWGPRGTGLICDFKFLSTDKFSLSSYELKSDKQLMCYAYWYLNSLGIYDEGVWIQQVQFYRKKSEDFMGSYRTFVCRRRVVDYINSIIQKDCSQMIEAFVNNQYEDNCHKCRFAYGRDSCEYRPVCSGTVTEIEYVILHNLLSDIYGKVPYCWQIIQCCDNHVIIAELKKISNYLLTENEGDNILELCKDRSLSLRLNETLVNEVKMTSENKTKVTTKTKRFYKEVTSPTAEAVFSHVTSPTENLRGDMQYEITLRLDPNNSEHQTFINEIDSSSVEAQKFLAEQGSTTPFRTLTWRADKNKEGEPTGKVLLKLSSKKKPTVMAQNGDILSLDGEISTNTQISVKLLMASYDFSGNAGVTNYLNSVTVLEAS